MIEASIRAQRVAVHCSDTFGRYLEIRPGSLAARLLFAVEENLGRTQVVPTRSSHNSRPPPA